MKSILIAVLAASVWALPSATDPPIACNLKALTAVQRKQLEQIGSHVISAITASRELKDGYAFRIDPQQASLIEVAQWLDVWRRCCPFYEFEIDFRASDAPLWLSVTGRTGVKQYIPLDSPRLAKKLPK
jgi:hypothetical protein